MGLLYGQRERLFITDLTNKYFTRQEIFEWLHLTWLCASVFFLELGHFLNIDISQGSVSTRLRCGGIFKYQFVANLPLSLSVKEF